MTRLTLVQGDTALLQFQVLNADATPTDLTPYEVVFTIKRSTQDADSASIFRASSDDDSSPVVIDDDPTTGLVVVTVPAEDMEAVRAGKPVYWDIELLAGDIIFTPLQGTILTTSEVTGA